MSEPQAPKTSKTLSRTQLIARLEPPPTRSGRVAFLASCASLIVMAAMFTMMCAGLNVLGAFVVDPVVAVLSMTTAAVFAVPYGLVILWLDRNDPEPPHLIATAFLWGAVLATGLSIIVNTTFGLVAASVIGDPALADQLTASISAPLVEELTKALALVSLYLFFHRDFDNVLDGVIYGALVGLGFAAFENFIYYTNTQSVGGVIVLTLIRGVLISIGSHACYTAITGAGVGLFRVMRTGVLRWAIPPLALMLAMFVHFAWNTFTNLFTWEDQSILGFILFTIPVSVTLLQMPFVAMVSVVSIFSLRHERQLIEKYLASEKAPVLHADELARLVPARRRTWHSIKLLATFRLGEWWTTRKRNQKLVRLAFEKWHMDQEAAVGTPIEGRAHALAVIALRKELTALQVATT